MRGSGGAAGTIEGMCVAPTPEQLVGLANGLAAEAAGRGDPAFGAVLVSPHGEVAILESNRETSTGDPTAHAEIALLRAAAAAGIVGPLRGYAVAVNAKPCSMCAAALVDAGVQHVTFSGPDGGIDVLDMGSNEGSSPPR